MRPFMQEIQSELDSHVWRERELRKLLKTAEAEQSAKEATRNMGGEEEEPIVMSQESMAKYLEENYRVVKNDNYDFMTSSYSSEVTDYQYPEDYTSPKFKVYNG